MTRTALHGSHFRRLHLGPGFVLPNAWDAGSARLFAGSGAVALGTTSAGFSFARAHADGRGALDAAIMLENIAEIVDATSLPVTADLENGWARSADGVARTVEQAVDIGCAGVSIEDSSGDPQQPVLPMDRALERVEAAVSSCRRGARDCVLTARAEGRLFGVSSLDEVIERLLAYQEAGADVLYAPGLVSLDEVSRVVAAVERPVNVLMGDGALRATVTQLHDLGVVRISLGSCLARVALAAAREALEQVLHNGHFERCRAAVPYADLNASLTSESASHRLNPTRAPAD